MLLKVSFLPVAFPYRRRKVLARQRGAELVTKDSKEMRTSLAVSAIGLVLGGLVTKDKYAALNAGLSGSDGVIQEFGEAR